MKTTTEQTSREINLFVDAISIPFYLKEKEMMYLEHIQVSNLSSPPQRMKIDEILEKNLLTSLFIQNKFMMLNIIKKLLDTFHKCDIVKNMLPLKTIGLILHEEKGYNVFLRLYKMFGKDFMMEIMLYYFDIPMFLEKLLFHILTYSIKVEKLLRIEEDEEDPSLYEDITSRICNERIQDIYTEGLDLIDLLYELGKKYQLSSINIVHKKQTFQYEDIMKLTKKSVSQLYSYI
jgi:hypothetical protein